MSQTLPQLEQRRQQLYRELEQLGDFRPGMISVRYRKCGKANCLCAHKPHPGHGPQYLWNTTQGVRAEPRTCIWARNWRRRARKWKTTNASRPCAVSWWRSMSRSASCARFRRSRMRELSSS